MFTFQMLSYFPDLISRITVARAIASTPEIVRGFTAALPITQEKRLKDTKIQGPPGKWPRTIAVPKPIIVMP